MSDYTPQVGDRVIVTIEAEVTYVDEQQVQFRIGAGRGFGSIPGGFTTKPKQPGIRYEPAG